MKCRPTKRLSRVGQNLALSYLSRIEMKGEGGAFYKPHYIKKPNNYKVPNSPYLEKMLSLNMLVCHKCMKQIKIGQLYTYVLSKVRIRKYYHNKCYEGMFI